MRIKSDWEIVFHKNNIKLCYTTILAKITNY